MYDIVYYVKAFLICLLIGGLSYWTGSIAGFKSYHEKMHESFLVKCPSKEVHHSITGSHICHLNSSTVQKLD